MTRHAVALALAALLAGPGCATTRLNGGETGLPRSARGQPVDPALLARYAQGLAIGSVVKVTLVDGGRVRGALMVVEPDALVVRPAGRLPEPPRTIPFGRIGDLELEQPSNVAKAIGIGAAAGAGAALAVFFIIIATFGD